VFNNAGVSVSNTVEKLSYEDFAWLMKINFWAVVHGTKAFLPYLKQVDEAHIINTSSIFGVVPFASQSAYNASKFAVRGFTEALRQELADTHIGVSCVQPGGIKTNIVKTSRYYAADNEAPTKEELTRTFEQMAALTKQSDWRLCVAPMMEWMHDVL
jgi:NADP-dependent 3-hydroxy acid dehydrogenase YdfG